MNEEFRKKIVALRGELGKEWLDDLPKIIEQYESKWGIKVLAPFQLSYNFVAPAKTNVVLKISFPKNNEFAAEIVALKLFDGVVAIKVLREDLENGIVLLEKAEPGERLRSVAPDKKQIAIASEVIKRLHKPIPEDMAANFPTVSDWGKVFDRYKKATGPVPVWMFDKAKEIFDEYAKDNKEQVLFKLCEYPAACCGDEAKQ